MFGFHVGREWSRGARPQLAQEVAAARAFFDAEGGATEGGGEGQPFAFQVFVAGPRNMKFTADLAEAHGLRDHIRACNAEGRPTWGVAHGTYMDMPWNTDKPSHHWTTKWIRRELRRAASAGLSGLVVHLNSEPADRVLKVLPRVVPPAPQVKLIEEECASGLLGAMLAAPEEYPEGREDDEGREDEDLERWECHIRHCAPIRPAREDATSPPLDCVRLYLETPHLRLRDEQSADRTEGLVPYDTPEKLCALFSRIRETVDPSLAYFGLCIDTAHIWSCGQDIASYADAADWLRRFEKAAQGVFPLGRAEGTPAVMFHLNDEVHPIGSGADEHARLVRGAMWGKYRGEPGASGLRAFTEFAQKYNIPTVLERKGKSAAKDPDGGFTTREALASDLATLREVTA